MIRAITSFKTYNNTSVSFSGSDAVVRKKWKPHYDVDKLVRKAREIFDENGRNRTFDTPEVKRPLHTVTAAASGTSGR